MTGESPSVPPDDDALRVLPDRPPSKLSEDELTAALARDEGRYRYSIDAEPTILAFIVGNFCSAYIQALAQRAENGAVNLPKRVADLVRKCVKRKGKPEEIHIGAGGEATATIALTDSTPDEARLALLDLDVTAEEVRGKTLRWDDDTMAWRADSADD